MFERRADEFVLASEVVVDARAGIVRIMLADQEQTLRGAPARVLLKAILNDEDFARIDEIQRGHCDKWGGDPWSGK